MLFIILLNILFFVYIIFNKFVLIFLWEKNWVDPTQPNHHAEQNGMSHLPAT